MGYPNISLVSPNPKSPGTRLYESALFFRELDYSGSIIQFDRAAEALEEELRAANPKERQGLLEKLYDCYQRVWVGAMSVGYDSAEYYGKRTVEIARELKRLD